MSRRVSRLRTEPPDRQPVLIVGAIVIGLVAGLVTIPRLFTGMDSRAENYVLLASSLYAQGESPMLLRDRLTSVGIQQPASTVLGLAQRYASSRDRKQQRQAESLEAFGKVLLSPDALPSPTPMPVRPMDTPAASATAVSNAPATRPAIALTPPSTPSPAATAIVAASPSPSSTALSASSTTPAAVQRGRVRPAEGGSALLRKDPNQGGGTLAVIPFAAQVEVLETVRGQALEGESRWLRVRYGSLTGYLWSKLVTVGD